MWLCGYNCCWLFWWVIVNNGWINDHTLESSVLFRTAKEDFAVLLIECSTSLLVLWLILVFPHNHAHLPLLLLFWGHRKILLDQINLQSFGLRVIVYPSSRFGYQLLGWGPKLQSQNLKAQGVKDLRFRDRIGAAAKNTPQLSSVFFGTSAKIPPSTLHGKLLLFQECSFYLFWISSPAPLPTPTLHFPRQN